MSTARQSNKRKAASGPKKKKDESLYVHFRITDIPDGGKLSDYLMCAPCFILLFLPLTSQSILGVSIVCLHCSGYNKPCVQKFNSSKGRAHLVNQCTGISNLH